MKNYEEMSDIQLSLEVAERNGMEVVAVAQDGAIVAGMSESFNINNPSHAWTIISENHISIELDEGCLAEAYVLASYVSNDDADKINCVDENPLRAAMICFLKMKDADVSE